MAKDEGGSRTDLERAQLVVDLAQRNLKQAPDDETAIYWRNFLAEAKAEVARLQREPK